MEKIKNLINPGRAQDNETLYGSGTNTGNTETTGTHGGLTGEGSHLASSTGNTSGLAGSQATGTSGIGSTNTGVASEASTDQAGRGIGNTGYGQSSQTSGLPGQGSHLSGARDTTSGTSGLAGNQTSGLGNTSNTAGTGSTSGLTGNQTSGLGNTNTSSTGQSNLARDAAATAAGTTAGNTRFAHQGQSGITSGTTTTTSSHMPGSWDDSYEQGSGNTGFGGANTSTGLGSGTVNPSTTQGTGQLGSSTGTSGLSQDPNTSSGHHLSRDAAAIGTAGTIGEGVHHHRENERGLGNTGSSANDSGLGTAKVYPPTTSHSTHLGSGSNYPSTASGTSGYTSTLPDRTLGSQQPGSTTGYGTGQSGNTSSGHQLGRDAAALGTAGAVGEGIHHHEHDKNLGNQEYTGTNRFMPLSSSTAQTGTSGSQPLASNTGYGSNQSGNTSSGHHLGRDAAAVGAAGAVGEGIHHHRENERGLGSTGATSGSHSYGSTTGPHSTDTANLLDPNISGGASKLEDAHEHHPHHGGGAEAADKDHVGGGSTTGSSGHHLGRDAAIGAGGAGAVGLAEHERNKHHNQGATGVGNNSGINQPTAGTYTSQTDPTSTNTTSRDHHYGRDAAVGAGGVGAAGLAEHEYNKHDRSQGAGVGPTTGTTNPTSTTPDPTTSSKDHHYGRDAAVAGGVGGAAYEADKHYKHDKDLTQAERDAKKQHKHDEKELKKEHKQEEKEHKREEKEARKESKGGLFGFLHRDKSKKYTPEEEAEFDRQEREHNSHKGRDAALGTAGVGALGAGAYEAEKHHDHQTTDTNKPLPYAPGNQGVGTGAGTQNALAGDSATGQSGHHYGRDAALGTGAAGAAGYAAHEHNKHEGATPLADKPVGQDLGDKLHGVDRNRGVPGSSGFPDTQGYGTGVHSEASTDQYGNPIDAGVTTGTGSQGHNLGRDAALGAGAAGVAGAGIHEHNKHDSGYQQGSTGYGNTTSGSEPTGSQQGQHHYGRDAAAVGGAGALGEHEYRKHEGAGQHTGLSGQDNTSSGLTGSQGQHHYGRDAAMVGGAGALGEHEYRKHEGAGQQTGLSGRDNTSSGLTGSQGQSGHHYGRDAAAVGGAGALGEHEYRKHENTTGATSSNQGQSGHHFGRDAAAVGGAGALGEHEYRKHDTTTGTGSSNQYDNSGLGYDQQQSGTTGSNITDPANDGRKGPNVVEGSDGRHRLHKDPPANHPASGASHVPASGSETQRMMQEGKQELRDDTGVANSGNERNNY